MRSGLRNLNPGKYTAKWGVQMAGMNYQARSSRAATIFLCASSL
ncbi:DUF6783 domain-containing protein [Robinsoniella peoriensis]